MSRLRQLHVPDRVHDGRRAHRLLPGGSGAGRGRSRAVRGLVLDVIMSDTGGVTQTVITVLEQMLLVFILMELAHSVHIVLHEQFGRRTENLG